jgi:hypothetical protein
MRGNERRGIKRWKWQVSTKGITESASGLCCHLCRLLLFFSALTVSSLIRVSQKSGFASLLDDSDFCALWSLNLILI